MPTTRNASITLLMTAGFFVPPIAAHGDIVHYSINTFVENEKTLDIDITGDGTDNFRLGIDSGGEHPYGWATRTFESLDGGLTQAAASDNVLDAYNHPDFFWIDQPDEIGPELSFSPSPEANTYTSSGPGFSSPWTGYLGFRTQIDGETHYGWIEMTLTVVYNGIVVDNLAYESTPNTPIGIGAIPAPGTLAVLALGLFTRRRRAADT